MGESTIWGEDRHDIVSGSKQATRARRAAQFLPQLAQQRPFARPGEFELELGPLQYLKEGHADFLIVPATVLNLGITNRGKLVADLKNFVSLDGSDAGLRRFRPRDADLLFKEVLRPGVLQDGFGPSIALETGALLPTPGPHTGVGVQANTIFSFATPHTALHLNESIAGNRDHRFEVFTSVILELGRQRRVRPVAEIFYDHVLHGGDEYSALVGAVWEHSRMDLRLRGARVPGRRRLRARNTPLMIRRLTQE